MEELIVTTFNMPMVLTSLAFAVLGSFLALSTSLRIVDADGKSSWLTAGIAGIALGGIGVWAMHFIGMLSLKMNVGLAYSMLETALSLIAAIAAASASLWYVARDHQKTSRVVVAGVVLGLCVCVMHYLGIFAMRINGYIRWDYSLVALSVFIAIAASIAALWLGFRMVGLGVRLLAAVIMGAAVSAMHYTGMAAAQFICTTVEKRSVPKGIGYIASFELPTLVILGVTLAAGYVIFEQATGHTVARKPPAA
jgi:NO-binding membrane sensor protein with MHYT domain